MRWIFIGGAALFGISQVNDAAFDHWFVPTLGPTLSNLVYWAMFILAAAIVIPPCQAGMRRSLGLNESGDQISN
jgi:hypothetical protein